MQTWHAIYVKSRTEKKVAQLLADKCVETYVPIVRTVRQWSDRKKKIDLPLLNGYVFTHITPQEQEIVLQTRSVVNFVRSEGKIARIRDVEIERLKQLVSLGYQMEACPVERNFRPGDRVRITSGALKGIDARIVDHGDHKLVEVLLESFGHSVTVRLPKEVLLEV